MGGALLPLGSRCVRIPLRRTVNRAGVQSLHAAAFLRTEAARVAPAGPGRDAASRSIDGIIR